MSDAPQTIDIDGEQIKIDGLLAASVTTVSSLPRTAVIMLLGLVMPIVAMIVVAGPMRGSIEWGGAFGPIAFVATALPGVLAAVVGLKWPRDWAVVGETLSQFKTMTTCANEAEAERVAAEINKKLAVA